MNQFKDHPDRRLTVREVCGEIEDAVLDVPKLSFDDIVHIISTTCHVPRGAFLNIILNR